MERRELLYKCRTFRFFFPVEIYALFRSLYLNDFDLTCGTERLYCIQNVVKVFTYNLSGYPKHLMLQLLKERMVSGFPSLSLPPLPCFP